MEKKFSHIFNRDYVVKKGNYPANKTTLEKQLKKNFCSHHQPKHKNICNFIEHVSRDSSHFRSNTPKLTYNLQRLNFFLLIHEPEIGGKPKVTI